MIVNNSNTSKKINDPFRQSYAFWCCIRLPPPKNIYPGPSPWVCICNLDICACVLGAQAPKEPLFTRGPSFSHSRLASLELASGVHITPIHNPRVD